MDTTTKQSSKRDGQKKRSLLNRLFGGDFLLKREMRPWYLYILFLFLLAAILVMNEQRIIEKRAKIVKLENEYKAELKNLKEHNQFIPYEENQVLIHKMQDRGFLLNEERNYTIVVPKPAEKKRHLLFFWKNRQEDAPKLKRTTKKGSEELSEEQLITQQEHRHDENR